jgi:MFS family permease
MALAGAGNLLTGLAWAPYAAFAMQTLRGVGTSAVDVGSSTLLQRTVPPEHLGRTFGNLYGLVGFAAGVSYLAGGAMLSVVSSRVVLAVAGCGALVVAALTAARLARFGSGTGDPSENESPER